MIGPPETPFARNAIVPLPANQLPGAAVEAPNHEGMSERPRILVLDLLESFARERDVKVRIERRKDQQDWVCSVSNGDPVEATGESAREAIRGALQRAGIEIPS